MALYFEAPKMRWLILSAIAANLSFLSRYPRIALTIAGLAGILLLNHFPWKRRIQDGLIYGSISLARNILLVLGVLLILAFVFTLAVIKREGRLK